MRTRALGLASLTFALAVGLAAVARTGIAEDQPSAAPADWDSVIYDQVIDSKEAIDIDKLLVFWAQKLHVPVVLDPQMVGQKMRLNVSDRPLTWGGFKQMLDFHDIVPEVRVERGNKTLYAHLRRNLAMRVAPPYPVVPVNELAQHKNEVVMCEVTVQHGAGNDIFATVRGLLVRDVNRIGNILYVRGPEQIIVMDFAENAAYYARVIQSLDVPGPKQAIKTFDLSRGSALDVAAAIDKLFPAPVTPISGKDGAVAYVAGQPFVKVVPSPRTNQLLVQAYPVEMAQIEELVKALDGPTSPLAPAARGESGSLGGASSSLWPLATICATLAFLGQTLILRRLQRRLGFAKA